MRSNTPFAFLVAAAAVGLATLAIQGVAQGPAPAGTKFATADVYAVVEQLLKQEQYTRANEEFKNRWTAQLDAIQKELARLESDIQVIPQSDPKYADILKRGREKQAEYEKAYQEQTTEFQALSTKQLIEAYTRARDAASRIAEARGYTHVFASRPPDRAILSTTLDNALQELLARPVVRCPPDDDLTKALAEDLKVELKPS